MDVYIRPEVKSDYDQIRQVNDLAYGRENEGMLIGMLRQHKDFTRAISLVAEYKGQPAGHIFLFPVRITGKETTHESLALALMAVLPEYQREGIGACLVYAGLEAAKNMGHKSVVIMGHKEYYPRFGFEPTTKWNIRAPFNVPDEYYMAIELVENGLQGVSGTVNYPDEFSVLN